MNNDFEIIEPTRRTSDIEPYSQNSILANALAGNIETIIGIAQDIVDIGRMKVQSDAILSKMEQDRKNLIAETEIYVMKKKADTKNVIDRMKIIQEFLRDFYSFNQKGKTGLSGEEFTKIISDVLASMG